MGMLKQLGVGYGAAGRMLIKSLMLLKYNYGTVFDPFYLLGIN